MAKKEKNVKSIYNRSKFKTVLSILIIVFSVLLLAVEGVVYYQRSYLTPFWVNGQSMYPTLNYSAVDKYGRPLGESYGSATEGCLVNYGVMNTHKSALKKLKRFDVVVTYYSATDTVNKIKRILGMPGETVEFRNDGDLYINGAYVAQPIDERYIRGASYPDYAITLTDNQYYVCGDNRRHSADSRNTGEPIEKEYITGKALYICGTCEVYNKGDGTTDIKNIRYSWPRKIK